MILDFGWFPSSQLGNPVLEAPASCLAKLELGVPNSQRGRWEPANLDLVEPF